MCRLQFSLPEAEPAGQQADGADQTFAAEDVSALEALLALGTDSMDFELPGRALPMPAAEETGAAEPAAQPSLTDAGKDDGRYHCPMPGCKRSFQELWRLKVHYRCGVGMMPSAGASAARAGVVGPWRRWRGHSRMPAVVPGRAGGAAGPLVVTPHVGGLVCQGINQICAAGVRSAARPSSIVGRHQDSGSTPWRPRA